MNPHTGKPGTVRSLTMLLLALAPRLVRGFDGPYGPWQDQDIGPTGAPGSGMYSNGTFTIRGSGADICCSTDGFHFTFRPWTGDCAFAIRITAVTNSPPSPAVDPFARLGIMFRATTDPASPHGCVLWRAGGMTAFQARDSDRNNLWTNGSWVTLPYWLKLVRMGETFSSYESNDGTNWTSIASTNIAMPETYLVGLAVTSHDYGTLCVASCDNLQIEAPPLTPEVTVLRGFNANVVSWTEPSTNATGFVIQHFFDTNGYWGGGDRLVGANVTNYADLFVDAVSYRVQALGVLVNSAFSDPVMARSGVLDRIPAPWQSADIGGVGVPGTDNYSSALFQIGGSGAGIGGTNDQFHFVYQKLSGDADVAGVFGPPNNWISYSAKMGLMFRQSLADDSPFAFVYIVDGALAADFRLTPGAKAISASFPSGYISSCRVTRRGNELTAYVSDYYSNGRPRALASQQIQMTDPVYVGMAVTSANNQYLQLSGFSAEIVPAAGNLGINRLADGTLSVSLDGELNRSYGIDLSTNLSEWVRVTNVYNNADQPVSIRYTIPNTNLLRQFFRAVLLP